MRFERPLLEARFISRPNRFLARVEMEGEEHMAHVPNTGRMRELLVPGTDVMLDDRSRPSRRTRFDLVAVRAGGVTVSVDSRVPNRVAMDALVDGQVPGWEDPDEVVPEHTWGSSRFDFMLSRDGQVGLVEVKGCTLVLEGGLSLFPDAPTERGRRHVEELFEAARMGIRGLLLVVIQRSDGRLFAPNDGTDPAFGDALRAAADGGVDVVALGTEVDAKGIRPTGTVPVDLNAMRGVTG